MKKVFRALLICFLVAALAATSFVIPASAATVDEGSSVGTVHKDQRVKSYDSRVALIYSEFPNGDKCGGTAFIFANNALMTAGHCLCNYDYGGEAKKVKVYIYSNGNFVEVYTAKKIIYDDRANIVDWGYGDSYKYDWGIIELDANIGNKYGYFDFDTEVTKTDKLTITGYPSDKEIYTQYSESGNAYYVCEDRIDYEISTYHGVSGGPTYKNVNGKDVVVGIVSCGDSSKRIDRELYDTMLKFRGKHYYIKYHADDVSSSEDDKMDETIVSYGTATPLRKNTFTKVGCRFAGWTAYRRSTREWCYKNPTTGKPEWYTVYNAPSGWEKYIYHDEQLTAAASGINCDTIDMYAQWNESSTSYTIYYNSNYNEGSMNPTTTTYGVKTKLSPNTFTNGSREFLGWTAYRGSDYKLLYENPDNPSECEWVYTNRVKTGWRQHVFKDGDDVYNLTGVDNDYIIMTAQWGEKTGCTIYYDANGGNGIMDSTFVKYGPNCDEINFILSKNTFNKDNYEFAGWLVKQEYDSSTVEPKCLYENPKNISEKGWYSEKKAPEGWTKCIYKDGDRFKVIKQDDKSKITLYAQWKKNNINTYTIEYNANGGSGTMDVTQGTCNVPTKLAKNTFTNGENKFAGWSAHRSSDDKWFYRNPKNGAYSGWYKENSQPVGWTKALYSNGCYVTISSDFKNDKITLYAQWKKIGTNLSNNNTTEVIKGDVDGDGALTINDVTKLQRYLAEFESFDEYQMKAADVNNDGEVNVKDITALQNLINN